MRNVFVEHDAGDDPTVGNFSSRNLLDLGIPFDVDLAPPGNLSRYGRHGLKRHIHHYVVPPRRKLGTQTALHQLSHKLPVPEVHRHRPPVAHLQRHLQRPAVPPHHHGRVQRLPHERLRQRHQLARQHDHGGGAVAHLLVLGAGELDHGFGAGVADVHLPEDAVAVVGEDDAAHGVQKHFEHGAGTEGGADDIGDGARGGDIVQLGFSSGFAFGVGVQHHNLSGVRHFYLLI
mmetsp:Transcript_4469/g.8701  ORF Transcript_4469/g.8701 Transcript_4469/m.8701 type:complete len:232 (+) Transcript_4469:1081-1776(+)